MGERSNKQRDEERGATGFPEPPGRDPGDISGDDDPHHSLNNPARDPDPTEWPDPFEKREDPKGPERSREDSGPGDISSSEPHPSHDPEAKDRWEGPKRDKLDD